ncbi:membrane protein YdbS with pleckstrin-like domain [Amycolatopsis lexingtonensis]|uniref:Membrane protein YdbS with pleckstrin-like domain n=1 Tax=Amycolatopsis lexingtonensis TaxID=218822 RepID=A0ABR9IH58_9PSEU|nr:PH domain-containing protein [Amycolatopsis lexingtonensis]MBE1502524.1 membrane protein YdbS with pleckstrin-like domain [Amycolatopsis lexingtonensis]
MPDGVVRLRPPRNALDRRAIAWWRTQGALVFGPAVLVLAALAALIPPAAFWLLVPAAVVAVLGVAWCAVLPVWWFGLHRWEVTGTAVYVRSGFLWQEWRVAPLSRVQTVDTLRGPLQQRFGLATVTVTTASARGAVKLRGLDAGVAADVAERLTERTEATPGDAT